MHNPSAYCNSMYVIHDSVGLDTTYTSSKAMFSVTIDLPPGFAREPIVASNSDKLSYCYECASTFETAVAWHNHRRAAHSSISRAQAIAPSSFCYACMTEFHTLTRIYEHLDRDSPLCLHKYEYHFDPLAQEQIDCNRQLRITQTQELQPLGYTPSPTLLNSKALFWISLTILIPRILMTSTFLPSVQLWSQTAVVLMRLLS